MKRLALTMIGLGLVTTAAAQSARVDMLPMPETLPQLLFAPDPIAGTMLRPLRDVETGAMTEIDPEPNPQAAVQTAVEPGIAAITEAATPEAPIVGADETTGSVSEAVEPTDAGAAEAAAGLTPPAAAGAATALAVPVEPEAATESAAPAGSSVHVIVENVESAAGIVNVAVCNQSLSEEGCPYKTSGPAAQGFVELKLDGIPPGNYAVVGYHDVNGNDEFDKFLGMPREPYALSSEAAESLVPRFQDAALPIRAGDNVVIIRLKTFGGG
jgi:uncharacterized protein (DUF2141 family)